jgi:hypothetical protein
MHVQEPIVAHCFQITFNISPTFRRVAAARLENQNDTLVMICVGRIKYVR